MTSKCDTDTHRDHTQSRRFLADRDRQPELMDDPNIALEDHLCALAGLSRLNRVSRIEPTIFKVLLPMLNRDRPTRILDIAAGSGNLEIFLSHRAAKHQLALEFTTSDISLTACNAVNRAARSHHLEIRTINADIINDPIDETYDIVMCHLFLHHLSNDEIVGVLTKMRLASTGSLVITDLIRSRFGYALAWIASRVLTRSPVVHADALLSVRGALRIDELKDLAKQAGFAHTSITKVWPERMVLTCQA